MKRNEIKLRIFILRLFSFIKSFNIILIMLFFLGCATNKPVKLEPTLPKPTIDQAIKTPQAKPETTSKIKVTPEMIDEYARIHQISDLKKAEFYLTNPEYAKENPYVPTEQDIAFYEGKFLERMYPEFKKMVEKDGFMKARKRLMENPPAGPGSFWVGSRRYGAMMQKLANEAGESAASGESNALLEIDPATANYQQGMVHYRNGKIDEAIKFLEKAVEIKPDSPSLQYNIGIMYMEKDNLPKAIEAFRNSIANIKSTGYTNVNLKLYPDVFMGALTNLGMLYTRVGLYDQAVESLKEAIRFRPDDVDANKNLAIAYYTMGDLENAQQQMQKYVKLDPNNAEAHNSIGLILYNKRQYESSLEYFKKARELKPDEKQYAYNEGLALVKLGRSEEAVNAFKDSSGLEEGKEMRQKFIEEFEANKWRELYNQGHSAMEFGSYTKAVELFKSVLEIKPDLLEAQVNIGYCYRAIGDRENAIKHFEQAVKLSPNSADINYNLALTYSESKMYEKAIERYNKVVELDPSYKEAFFGIGTAYYKMSKYADSAKAFEKAVEVSPNWLEPRLNLGSCYLKIGDTKGAIAQFLEAVKINPRSSEAHYNLGIAYMKDTKYKDAELALKKAIEIDPSHKMAKAMLKELEIYQNQ